MLLLSSNEIHLELEGMGESEILCFSQMHYIMALLITVTVLVSLCDLVLSVIAECSPLFFLLSIYREKWQVAFRKLEAFAP